MASFAAIAAILAASTCAEGLTTINLTPRPDPAFATGGDMGQIITAPTGSDTRLDSFEFYGYGAGGDIQFRAGVYLYDAIKNGVLAGPLYISDLRVASRSTMNLDSVQTFTFVTGGIDLIGGEHYLFALQQYDYHTTGNLQMCVSSVPYDGGDLRLSINPLRYVAQGPAWNSSTPENDLGFKAVFTTVPEPASLSLFGLGAIALLRRRRAT